MLVKSANELSKLSPLLLGMDRIVRMWNPYVPGKPTGLLRGHNAPIFFVFIAEEEDRIFSLSTDKLLKVKCLSFAVISENNCADVRPLGSHCGVFFPNVVNTTLLQVIQMYN